jgi:carbon storage regulator
MLVFTRRRRQTIRIGDGIEVQVLRIGRDGVRLGVVAPPDVPVHRQEVYEQIREANRTAAGAALDASLIAQRLGKAPQRVSATAEDSATTSRDSK